MTVDSTDGSRKEGSGPVQKLSREEDLFILAAVLNVLAVPIVALASLVSWPDGTTPEAARRRRWLHGALALGLVDVLLIVLLAARGGVAPAGGLEGGETAPRALGVIAGDEPGAAVEKVLPATAADSMGLRPGDILESVGGSPSGSMTELKILLRKAEAGQSITVRRGGEVLELRLPELVEPPYMKTCREGYEAIGRDDLDEGRRRLLRALEEYPGPGRYVEALLGLADIALRLEDRAGAAKYFEEAHGAAAPSERERPAVHLAALAVKDGEGARAERWLQDVEDPEQREALRAGAAYVQGRTGEALLHGLAPLRDLWVLLFPAGILAASAFAGGDFRKDLRFAAWATAALALTAAAAFIGAAAWAWGRDGNPFSPSLMQGGSPGPLEIGLACQSAALILLSIRGFRSFREDPAEALAGAPLPAGTLLGWSITGACLLYGVSVRVGLAWLAAAGPEVLAEDPHPLFRIAFQSPGSIPWLLPLVAIAGPIGEELFFRGFLLGRLRRRLGPARAIAVTALAFGMMHPFSARYIAGTAGLGLALGYLRERSGSLGPPIAAHALFNGFNFLLAFMARGIPV